MNESKDTKTVNIRNLDAQVVARYKAYVEYKQTTITEDIENYMRRCGEKLHLVNGSK